MSLGIVRTGGSSIDRSAFICIPSSQDKPTKANGYEIPDSSILLYKDTGALFFYNEATDEWYDTQNWE